MPDSEDLIIGIDRGASVTDFAVVQSDKIIESRSITKRDWDSVYSLFEELAEKYPTDHLAFTGAATDMPQGMKEKCTIISEMDAIGFGGSAMANAEECIVVSMGTGTAVVQFSNSTANHIGGTGIGGGTIKGLGSLICGVEDPQEIEKLALQGKSANVNLTIGDLGYNHISFLAADMTASNFAAIKSKTPQDLAAGILTLVAETVGVIVSICAREASRQQKIVMVGRVANNQFIRRHLESVGKLYQAEFVIPENPGLATVFGTTVKYRFDLVNRK